jgi:hypothetical protein
MQPQPVSEVKPPSWSPNEVFKRIVKERADAALGSGDRGIMGKPVLYVIHTRDSKSSRKAGGQPPSCPGSSYANEASKLLEAESGGVPVLWGMPLPGADVPAVWAAVSEPSGALAVWGVSKGMDASAVGGVVVELSSTGGGPYVLVSSV